MRLLALICCLTLTCCHTSAGAPEPSPTPSGSRVLDGNDAPDSHIIDPIVKEHAHEIKFCGSAGGRDPRRVAIAWLVGEDGSVTKTRILSIGRQSDIGVAQCVVAHLKTWKFPTVPGGSYWANYPFSFED